MPLLNTFPYHGTSTLDAVVEKFRAKGALPFAVEARLHVICVPPGNAGIPC
jgi:hypothetical protein